ncbi:hypothetical protein Klosneuvirus_2_209 [Klosneuvirus KNV1]|uniref:Alpha/beta hydrolase n=1 Tax=Klosneuvirus KNV1 TaxID=1977640 RepID=A0A1V0SJ85_9VIRU|nr:hypothetical protein Klosneuvirus_2_209 [Klosneuvirus KNV1]
MSNKLLAIETTLKYEQTYKNQKYVFIDNKQTITNVIFTGCNQRFYMMITWFRNVTNYNFLYINANLDDTMIEIIKNCNSEYYNLIGISYGAAIAIYLSDKLPTYAVISIDPQPINLQWNLDEIFSNNNSVFFFHHSIDSSDIPIHESIITAIRKTSIMYMVKCSQYPLHSANIPDEHMIMTYITFVENIKKNNCGFIMKNIKKDDLFKEITDWT